MIKFTVVTCTYNAERVLQRTLDSVNKQTYCNIEHLIIDGVSKDKNPGYGSGIPEQGKGLERMPTKSWCIRNPTKGLLSTLMNKGIDRATGDYLVFLECGRRVSF